MGEIVLKGVLSLLPIIWLIVALTGLKMAGHKACVGALIITIVESLFLWKMPAVDCATSALEGFASALWPIILVIIAAIFTYNLSLKTGAMDVIKQMLTGVSADKRVLVLLIGWCFGGFMEGMAGFGTATNLLTLISPDETVELPLMDKQQAAHVLLDHILSLRDRKPRP